MHHSKRFSLHLVVFVSIVFVSLMTLLRIVLVACTPAEGGLTLPLVLRALGTGLVFDIATLSYLLVPVGLYLVLVPGAIARSTHHLWVIRIVFWLFVSLLLFDCCAEFLFFDEFGTRFNFIAVDYLIYTREVVANIRESYPLPLILSLIAAGGIVMTVILRRPLEKAAVATFTGAHRRVGLVLLFLPFVTYLTFSVARMNMSRNNYANELAANGIYTLGAAFRNNELDFDRFYRTAPLNRVTARLRTLVTEPGNSFVDPGGERFTRRIMAHGPERRLNLIVVVEESLSSEYLGVFGNREGLTPNLDRLANESLSFTSLYATGTRTVRGLEALTLSIPPLPGTSIVKRPDNAGFRSWGTILKEKGYDTKYIYAGYGYFDNMNAFFSGNGFSIVDRADFGRDEITFANAWGVCDEDLFRKVIREADRSHAAGKPFFSMVMTTSNHRPFTYPDGKIDIPSGSGRKGGVKYADHAIGRLLEEAKGHPWFRDTLFVIVADHCAGSAGKTDIPVRRYEIPLLVHAPAHIRPGKVDRMMSQIDVAPTILGLMNLSYDTDFLGRDILKSAPSRPRAFISTYQKLGYLTDDRLLVLAPRTYQAEYRVDRATGTTRPEPIDENLMEEMLSWYQGAHHIYTKRLNRIERRRD